MCPRVTHFRVMHEPYCSKHGPAVRRRWESQGCRRYIREASWGQGRKFEFGYYRWPLASLRDTAMLHVFKYLPFPDLMNASFALHLRGLTEELPYSHPIPARATRTFSCSVRTNILSVSASGDVEALSLYLICAARRVRKVMVASDMLPSILPILARARLDHRPTLRNLTVSFESDRVLLMYDQDGRPSLRLFTPSHLVSDLLTLLPVHNW